MNVIIDASEEESTTDEVAEVMSHDTTIALDFPPEQPDFATRFDSSLIEVHYCVLADTPLEAHRRT